MNQSEHDRMRDRALAAEALTAELRKALDVASDYNLKNSRRAVEAEAALSMTHVSQEGLA